MIDQTEVRRATLTDLLAPLTLGDIIEIAIGAYRVRIQKNGYFSKVVIKTPYYVGVYRDAVNRRDYDGTFDEGLHTISKIPFAPPADVEIMKSGYMTADMNSTVVARYQGSEDGTLVSI